MSSICERWVKAHVALGTGVTRENEPVVTNELEEIALKANPAQPLGRQAANSGKD